MTREQIEQEDRWIEEAARELLARVEQARNGVLEADMALERLHRLNDVELFDGAEGADLRHELAVAARALRHAMRLASARVELLDEEVAR